MTPNDYMRAYALAKILTNPECKYVAYSRRHNSIQNRRSYLDINPEFIDCFKSIDNGTAIITTILIALIPGVIFILTGWGTCLFLFLLFTFVVSLAMLVHKIKRLGDLWK